MSEFYQTVTDLVNSWTFRIALAVISTITLAKSWNLAWQMHLVSAINSPVTNVMTLPNVLLSVIMFASFLGMVLGFILTMVKVAHACKC